MKANRRDFIKTAAAGLVLASSGTLRPAAASARVTAWRPGLAVNPAIDNTKAVCCYDEAMVTNKNASGFTNQNAAVNTAAVEKNMDEMAKKLANLADASAAWKTIFMKPAAKQWNQVTVAIKVNCIYSGLMPHVPIVGKLCKELITTIGVTPANITIFDSCSGAGAYAPGGRLLAGLPAGIVVRTQTKDGPMVPVGAGTLRCTPVIAKLNADNTISYIADILINCAVNKGHGSSYGGFTMCMKNHTGTLKYSCPSSPSPVQEMINENQCEAIIGEGSANVPCRQQLCVIDSLWAAISGPGNAPTHVPCRIVMGTVAPVVDYLTAENIRKKPSIMNTSYNTTAVTSWLTAFGLPAAQCQWVEFTPSTGTVPGRKIPAAAGTVVRVEIDRPGKPAAIEIALPSGDSPITVGLFNMQGRLLREATLPPSTDQTVTVAWNGYHAKAGSYMVKCRAGATVRSAAIKVID